MSLTTEVFIFRKAEYADARTIWEVIQQAIERRKRDGSTQWQDGYPNPETINDDIEKDYGYVLTLNEKVVAYAALIFDIEPAYEIIDGKWLTDGNYCAVHRIAVSDEVKGKGVATLLMKKIETFSIQNSVFSIKIDTNFDNPAMLKILKNLGYQYCGEVYFHGAARKAFEKMLN